MTMNTESWSVLSLEISTGDFEVLNCAFRGSEALSSVKAFPSPNVLLLDVIDAT